MWSSLLQPLLELCLPARLPACPSPPKPHTQVRQLHELGQLALDAAKANSDFKLSFKGKAYKTAADVSVCV